jgi:hypothetical protein
MESRCFVLGDAEHGYALSHWRFQDYLIRRKISKTAQAPSRNRLVKWCSAWRENKSVHALRFLPAYLLASLAEAADPQPAIEQPVVTLCNPTYAPNPIRFRESLWIAIQAKRALAAAPGARLAAGFDLPIRCRP